MPEAEILRFQAPDGLPQRSIFISNLANNITSQIIKVHFIYLFIYLLVLQHHQCI